MKHKTEGTSAVDNATMPTAIENEHNCSFSWAVDFASTITQLLPKMRTMTAIAAAANEDDHHQLQPPPPPLDHSCQHRHRHWTTAANTANKDDTDSPHQLETRGRPSFRA